LELESGKYENRKRKTSCVPAFLIQISWFPGFQIPSSLSDSAFLAAITEWIAVEFLGK
jgi:hypothetical protein